MQHEEIDVADIGPGARSTGLQKHHLEKRTQSSSLVLSELTAVMRASLDADVIPSLAHFEIVLKQMSPLINYRYFRITITFNSGSIYYPSIFVVVGVVHIPVSSARS